MARDFHKATAKAPVAFNCNALLDDLEKLCVKAKKDGLPEDSTDAILEHARATLGKLKSQWPVLPC